MARFSVGSGSVRLNVSDGLRDLAERAARQAAPETVRVLEQQVDQLVADAREKWPVGRERHGVRDGEGRPHSRELFDAEIVVDLGAGIIRGRVTNSAPYAYQIKSSQNGIDGSPWQILVAKPFKARTPVLVDALKAMTDRLVAAR